MTLASRAQARLRTVPKRVAASSYVDLDRRVETSILVASSGRSGSTWVAEVVNHDNGYRLVFEPFRRDVVRRARNIRYGQFLDPTRLDDPLAEPIEALLAGRVRSTWTDGYNRKRIARRRIVKEIRVTNLLPWIRARFPELPIVYIVRHPLAVARSWSELGWGHLLGEFLAQDELLAQFRREETTIRSIAESGEPMERHLLRWCLENALPLRLLRPDDAHVILYERLRADPEAEFRRIFHYLGKDFDRVDAAVLPRRSATADYRRHHAVDVEPRWESRARELMEIFGLADLYSEKALGA